MARNFQSSSTSYGGGLGRYFICKVVNRDDPQQGGRLQIRVMGYQNDEGMIPDEDLHWARPIGDMQNPQNGGIGKALVGAMASKDDEENCSYYMGFYAADQIPMLLGSIGKDGKDDGTGNLDPNGRNHDMPRQARDDATNGGDYRYDQEKKDYSDKSITEFAAVEAKNPHQREQAKESESEDKNKAFSIGAHKYDDV